MENDYDFWEGYLKKLKKEIKELCRNKEDIYIDFHIHSDYSADGKQSLSEIIESTRKKGFDIISITDHDCLDVYNELYNMVKDGMTNPLIVPGIEFTIDNRDYGNQCHLLQLFVNPKDLDLRRNVEINYMAMFNRSKIQFERLKENISIQTILRKNKMKISYDEYIKYLELNNLVPEYDTLSFYLIDKFKKKMITTFDILEQLEIDNENDCYDNRKEYKRLRFKKLREKYEIGEKNNYNSRFLLSMLAVKEVDDDWWEKPSSGSLSVNSYGQMTIRDINNKYKIFFAHPTEKKISVVENIIDEKKNIIGLEMNVRNNYDNIDNFNNLLSKKKLLKIIGSDSHDSTLQFYDDMNYYRILSKELLKIIKKI